VHTAVKIEPKFNIAPVVHVLDASRAVTVAGNLLGQNKDSYVADIREEYTRLREMHEKKRSETKLLTINEARAQRLQLAWGNYTPLVPKHLGRKVLENVPLNELVEYIDWTPFFQTWELAGRYPKILTDEVVGEEATRLYNDARSMLQKIVHERWLKPSAVLNIMPANAVGDDIEVYADNNEVEVVFHMLRQQTAKAAGVPALSLADFVAPKDAGLTDYVGGFVVTAGTGIEPHLARFEDDHDDYSSIMLKALADRLAEAAAEWLHAKVRREYWGYAANENLDNEALIAEKYQGIRPAPGYPACPDHTEKLNLFKWLDAESATGVSLTESLAMYPASSVCGWYFSHPESKYFGIVKIGADQLQDFAQRTGISQPEMQRLLGHLI
jgi:5-methyltetrahydrofolate--homocysteine methyltransferase